jgi:hypothetical protein
LPTEFIDGLLEANATVHLRKGKTVQTGSASGLYITGRGVCCCQTPEVPNQKLLTESVLWEQIMSLQPEVPVGDVTPMRVADANRVRAEIDRMMVRSVNDPDRYAVGTVSFAETQLVARSMANLISGEDHPEDHALENIKGLDSQLIKKIGSRAPNATRSDLLQMSPAEQSDRFDLSAEEVRKLRRAIVGLEGPLPAPPDRWDPPGTRTEERVPNVAGLTFAEAEAALQALEFFVGEVVDEDSELPTGIVIAQHPEAEATMKKASSVNLVLATGLSVRIPDAVGVPLSQALVMLRDAGLKSEPEISFVPSGENSRREVIEISPPMRSYVTPHASVTIRVSG